MLNIDPLIVKITGVGGTGGSSIGEILARSAARFGYYIQCSRAFPAEIKGGTAWFQLRVSSEPLGWWGGQPHLELSGNRRGEWELSSAYQATKDSNMEAIADVSPLKIAKATGNARNANLVALGLLAGTLGLDVDLVVIVAAQRYRRSGGEIDLLREAIVAGYSALDGLTEWNLWNVKPPEVTEKRLIINGNEAITLGALAAGVRFFAGYPITPASSILEFMLHQQSKLGGVALQMEDEIAALASCLGASYAGKRAMCATSGPGFALMSELLNLSVNAEIPVTIVDVQRSGPSTGQPSRSKQADLLYAIHGSPGESPRIVLAPSTVEEALHMTIQAVNLSERYQMPVILLSDGELSNRIEAVPEPDWDAIHSVQRQRPVGMKAEEFQRYLSTPTGVSDMPLPGSDDLPYIAGGMEHDDIGMPSAESRVHHRMSMKRLNKLEAARAEFAAEPEYNGLAEKARVGIIGWGSTRGAIEEGVSRLRENGVHIATAQIRWLNPLPEEKLTRWMGSLDKVIVAEENQSGQLAKIIKHLVPEKLTSLLPGEKPGLTPEMVMDFVNAEVEETVMMPAYEVAG